MSRAIRLSFLALLLTSACPAPRPDPEEALKTFLSDLRNGRSEAAWSSLSAASRRELERRHEALERAAGVKSDASAAQLLFEDLGLMVINPPESIAQASPQGRETTLRVSIKDGRSADVRMVLEENRWVVDLIGSMKPSPPLEAGLEGRRVETSTAGE
jgi:hypothetical protein